MKILLLLSLVLNSVMIYLYYQEKNLPPIERIIMEQHEKPSFHANRPEKLGAPPRASKLKKERLEEKDPEHPFGLDPVSLDRSIEDMDIVKKDFLEKNEIPEQFEIEKAKILGDFYEKTAEVYKKFPTGMAVSFSEKRKLIDMEEEAHRKIEKIYGKEKWEKYKSFIDSYNKKLLDGYMTGDYTGPLLGY